MGGCLAVKMSMGAAMEVDCCGDGLLEARGLDLDRMGGGSSCA